MGAVLSSTLFIVYELHSFEYTFKVLFARFSLKKVSMGKLSLETTYAETIRSLKYFGET